MIAYILRGGATVHAACHNNPHARLTDRHSGGAIERLLPHWPRGKACGICHCVTRGIYRARRVRLNSQGYDAQGNYWGHGAPLFFAERLSDGESDYMRATDAAHAREILAKRLGADPRAPRFGGTRR